MNPFFCNYCGTKIDFWARRNARFCSDYCRKAYYEVLRGRKSVRKRFSELVSVGKVRVGEVPESFR